MIERYTLPEMSHIWGEKNYYRTWLKVEEAVLKARGDEELASRIKDIYIGPKEIREREKYNGHELNAFLDIIEEEIGAGSERIHRGLTSFDIMDTARILQIKDSLLLIEELLRKLRELFRRKALEYENLLMTGRTHGRIAEPVTLGIKFARFYALTSRNIERLEEFKTRGLIGKISGAVGGYSLTDTETEKKALETLGLTPAPISSQVLPRDIFAEYLALMAFITSGAAESATEVRLLSQDGIDEVFEKFSDKQTGSSAMPHKKNPVISERICGLARLVSSYVNTGFANTALWNERDITHSSNERIIIEDASILTHYILKKTLDLFTSISVDEKNIQRNFKRAEPLMISSAALSILLEKGVERSRAYSLIKDIFQKDDISLDKVTSLLIEETGADEAEITEKLNPQKTLKNIPQIFERLGIRNS